MTAIDRTAYPRPGDQRTREELTARYTLSKTDRAFLRAAVRSDAGRLTLAALLKLRQDFGCFPALPEVNPGIVAHLASQLALTSTAMLDETSRKSTFHHYRAAVRSYLNVSAYDETAERLVAAAVTEAARTMSDPADLINLAIEALGKAATDLPAFSTLDRQVNHLRAKVHTKLYGMVAARLAPDHIALLDDLLRVPAGAVTTGFNRLKQTPGPARPSTIRLWTDRLAYPKPARNWWRN